MSYKSALVLALTLFTWTVYGADVRVHEGYSFKNGKVVMMKEGKETVVGAEVTLRNGARLTPDGFIVFKEGRRERLADARWIGFDGEWIADDAVVVADDDDFDGYYLEGGRVYVIRDRRPVLVTAEITLSNGWRLAPDGVIVTKEGTRNHLTEGQRVNKEGKFVERKAATTHSATDTREKPVDTSRKLEDRVKTPADTQAKPNTQPPPATQPGARKEETRESPRAEQREKNATNPDERREKAQDAK